MIKGLECFEDDEVTLPKVKKLACPIFPLIVQVNHPTRLEDNSASVP